MALKANVKEAVVSLYSAKQRSVPALIGIGAGVAGTWAFCYFSNWNFLVGPTAAALGFVVACLVGTFFGLQPAHQAARLDPIAALRSG